MSKLNDVIESQNKVIHNLTLKITPLCATKQTEFQNSTKEGITGPCKQPSATMKTRSQTLDGAAAQEISTPSTAVKEINTKIIAAKTQTTSDSAVQGDSNKNLDNEEPFKTVINRKSLRGKKCNTTLSAVQSRKWILVSNLVKSTTEDDVRAYLQENNITISECHRLPIKSPEIGTFKIALTEDKYNKIFQEDLWPLNTIVRPFKNFRMRASIQKIHTTA